MKAESGKWKAEGRGDGFTLVELLIVVALIGLITATAMIRFTGVTGRARMEQAVARLAAADAMMRSWAVRHDRAGQLRMELGSRRIERVYGARERPVAVALGQGVVLDRFVSTAGDTGHSTMTVEYWPQGTSPTYAVALSGSGARASGPPASGARASGGRVWLLFAGATGQMTRLEDESDVEAVLQALE